MVRTLIALAAMLQAQPTLAQPTATRTEQLSAAQVAALKQDPGAAALEDGTVLVFRGARPAGLPGLCSQDVVRIPPGMQAGAVTTETTFRNAFDPRTGRAEEGGPTLADACAALGDATTKAPDARTAWLAAYAVELVRDELKKADSAVLTQTCVEGSSQCRDQRLLLELVKRDQIVRTSPIPCRAGGQVCLDAIGFFDPYASKIQGKALFVKLHAELVSAGPAWLLKSATLEETLLDPVDDD